MWSGLNLYSWISFPTLLFLLIGPDPDYDSSASILVPVWILAPCRLHPNSMPNPSCDSIRSPFLGSPTHWRRKNLITRDCLFPFLKNVGGGSTTGCSLTTWRQFQQSASRNCCLHHPVNSLLMLRVHGSSWPRVLRLVSLSCSKTTSLVSHLRAQNVTQTCWLGLSFHHLLHSEE